jgi:hypothetical protein
VSSDFLDTDKAQSTMIDEADERVFLNTVYLTGICPHPRRAFFMYFGGDLNVGEV